MTEFTIVQQSQLVSTIEADNETQARDKWKKIRAEINGRRLTRNTELVVEGENPKVFDDPGREMVGRASTGG